MAIEEKRKTETMLVVSKPSLRPLQSQCGAGIRIDILDQWNRIDSTEIKPYIYGLLIFNMGTKATQCGKSSLFKWCWDNCTSTHKIMKLDSYMSHHIRKLTPNGSNIPK